MNGTFRSLNRYNYRVWAAGAIVSNVGTWMQRIAQDWVVLTQLTHNNATAVGLVMALQFGPQLLLLPITGFAADHLNLRKLLIATQAALGLLALGLGILTVAGYLQLWHVYLFALLLGCVSAFDAPARQTFVSELVGEADLSNAVALNSTSFNAARMIGPAIAGVLIAAVGSGWVFLINAGSFAAVIVSLNLLRVHELHVKTHAQRTRGSLADGFRYVARRADLKTVLLMLFLIATFGLNFPIFISTMAVTVFHAGAGQYGLLTSTMAVGSVVGALLSAGREKPRIILLFAGAALFGFRLRARGDHAQLLAVRHGAGHRGCVGSDVHHDRERCCTVVDRAGDARSGDGDLPGDRARRHTDRRTDCGVGGGYVRPAVGARSGCGGGLWCGDRWPVLPAEVSKPPRRGGARVAAIQL